jgi:hypothetical protein
MQTTYEIAQHMLDNGLDWSEDANLGNGDLILCTFFRDGYEQVYIVDMSEAQCSPDAGKKIGLVLSQKAKL